MLLRVLLSLSLCFVANIAQAQSADGYPSRQIKLVVPYTPGSGIDSTARMLAEKLPLVLPGAGPGLVENRPGASGTIGTASVARAVPDGLTLMVAPTTHVITAAVKKIDYNPVADFVPIVQIGRGSFVVAVPAGSPAKTLADLVRQLQAAKGQATYSSAGIASTVHLFTETLLQATRTKATHIPGKGVTGALMDVMQGQVDFTVAPLELALQQVKSGKVRLLAQTTGSRDRRIPDVPTVAESGYAGFEATYWLGLYAPAGTPPAIVTKLNRAVNELMARPDVLQFMDLWAMEPVGGTPEQFLALNKADLVKFTAVAKSASIVAE